MTDKPKEKWVENADGFLELMDLESGKIIAKQVLPKKLRSKAFRKRPLHHYVRDDLGRLVWVPAGYSADDLPRNKAVYPYSRITCGQILDLISHGVRLKDIALMEGFPPLRVIQYWKDCYEEFSLEWAIAEKAAADYYADKAIETAEKTNPKKVRADALRVDTYKWASEVKHPEKYGKRTKIVGDPDAPLQMIIDTGIRRPEDDSAIETVGVPVKEIKNDADS